MAGCNKRIYRGSSCNNFEVGDARITVKQCDKVVGSFTTDQCADQTLDIPCNKPNWSEFPFCDDCWEWCEPLDDQRCIECEDDAPAVVAEPEPVVYAKPVPGYLLKFWSSSCGICGRMKHYDWKIAEELGLGFISVQRGTDEWDKYEYVLDEQFPDDDTVGYPTYIVAGDRLDGSLAALGHAGGGADKGKFRERVKSVLESAQDVDEPVNAGYEVNGWRYSAQGLPIGKEVRSEPKCDADPWGDCDKPNDEDDRFHWQTGTEDVTLEICGKDEFNFPQKTDKCPVDGGINCGRSDNTTYQPYYKTKSGNWISGPEKGGTDKHQLPQQIFDDGPGSYDAKIIAHCKNSRVTDPGDDCCGYSCIVGKTFTVKIKDNCPDDTPKCDDALTPSLDCGSKCTPGSKVTLKGHASGANNSKLNFKYYKGSKSDDICVAEGMGLETAEVDCPACGESQKYSLWVSAPGGECTGEANANCDLTAEDCGEPEPTPCQKTLNIKHDAPTDCGTPGTKALVTCEAEGVPTADCTWEWQENGEVVGSGNILELPYPTGYNDSRTWQVTAKYKDAGSCDLSQTINIGLHTCDDPNACDPPCEAKDCLECRSGTCVDKCDDLEGYKCDGNGNCVSTECGKTLTIKHDAPTECGQPNDTVRVTCEAEGVPTNDCTWTWKENDEVVSNGNIIDLTWPSDYKDSRTWTVTAYYKDAGNCELSETVNIGLHTCEDPNACDPPCVTSDCMECRNGTCVDKCDDLEGYQCDGSGNCVETNPPGPDCGEDFKVTFTCPTKFGTPGSTVTVTSSTNKGDDDVDYEWYIDSLDSDHQVSEDKSYVYTYPADGVCEELFAYANYTKRDCEDLDWVKCQLCGSGGDVIDLCANSNCDPLQCEECNPETGQCDDLCLEGLVCDGQGNCVDPTPEPTDPPEPEPTDPPGPDCDPPCNSSQCLECRNGNCVNKCDDLEGYVCDGNGNCIPEATPEPEPESLCKDVVCGDCQECDKETGNCVDLCANNQNCVGGECVDDPCYGVDCPECHECQGGVCVDLCADDEICVNGKCEKYVACDSCDGNGGWALNWNCARNKVFTGFGQIRGGSRITITPSHGDLTKGDVMVTAAGNTAPGVDILYDPIFVDMERDQPVDQPQWVEYDFMGSGGVIDPSNNFPFMQKDVWTSPWTRIPDFPADANGCFIELYFAATLQSGAKYQQDHPCYQLEVPVEIWSSVKNVMHIKDGEFAAGVSKDSMHSDVSHMLTGKLSPVTAQDAVYSARDRSTRMNFAWCNADIAPQIHTSIYVKTYNYARISCTLGRVKVIPVRVADKELALRDFILPQIDRYEKLNVPQPSYVDGLNTNYGYKMNEKDCVRLQGDDLRQAVWALDGLIAKKLATGADAGPLNQLRSDLHSQILEGDGSFAEIRNRLTALKNTAASLGVIGLTKLERNAGVSWTHPNNEATGTPQ